MATREELYNDPEESFRIAHESMQSKMWTALPAIVTSVNYAQNTISAQPTIQGQMTDANGNLTNVNYPLLVDVPVCWPHGGNFAVTFPLIAGDEVLVIFSSRCIDAWWQNSGINTALENRMHDLSDGFAIPGCNSVPKAIPNIQTDGLELRTFDRSVFIKLSTTGITVNGNLIINGNTMQMGNTTQVGNITNTGSFTNNGANTLNGNVNTTGNLLNNGKFVGSTHTHPVTVGAANTGAPN